MGAFPLPFTISQLVRATLGFAADRPIFDDAALPLAWVWSSAAQLLVTGARQMERSHSHNSG